MLLCPISLNGSIPWGEAIVIFQVFPSIEATAQMIALITGDFVFIMMKGDLQVVIGTLGSIYHSKIKKDTETSSVLLKRGGLFGRAGGI